MRTFRVSLKRLKGSEYASLMMRLAMIVNDIATVGVLFHLAPDEDKKPAVKNSDPVLRKIQGDRQLSKGFQMYAFRMLVGHFCEGMKIIKILMEQEAAENKELNRYLERLSPETAKDYEFLKKLWDKDSSDEEMFKKRMQEVRHSIAFHYEKDDKHITKTIANMADRGVVSITSLIVGSDIYDTRFFIADDIAFNAVADSMWGVVSKDKEETIAKIDEILAWCGKHCKCLRMVGIELCSMYFCEKSV